MSCEEKQSQRGVLPRKIADKKSGQCSTSVLIHGYLIGGGGATAMEAEKLTGQTKPLWVAGLWQDVAAWGENLVMKVHYVDAHDSGVRPVKNIRTTGIWIRLLGLK